MIHNIFGARHNTSGSPTTGQGMKFNGTLWVPTDFVEEGDAAGGGLGGTYPNPTVTPSAGLDTTAVHSGDAAGGDLSGTYPSPSVVNDSHTHSNSTLTGVPGAGIDTSVTNLRGNTVSSASPSTGDFLRWSGSQWEPSATAGVQIFRATNVSLPPNPSTYSTGALGFTARWMLVECTSISGGSWASRGVAWDTSNESYIRVDLSALGVATMVTGYVAGTGSTTNSWQASTFSTSVVITPHASNTATGTADIVIFGT